MAVDNFVFCRSRNFIETTEGVIFIFYSRFPYQLRVRKFRRNLLINKQLGGKLFKILFF
jgi:hypothetical protein